MMTSDLKPYPAYKGSGVEWLGEVPRHWEVRRLKQICRLAYGNTLTTEMRQDGTVPVFGSNGCVGFHSSANTKAPCIVVGRKGSFGKVNYSRDSVYAIDTTFFIDSRFSGAHIRWLFFLLGWLRLDEVTKDSAVPGLDREDAYQRLAPVPPLPEQTAIVRFLDHADRRIRRYIRAKQKLIALLEEQKQAIIHQAVTGQIDVRTGEPYPAYKPSGVEWLEGVPAHWEVIPFKQRVGFQEGPGIMAADFRESGVPLLRISCLRKEVATLSGCNYLDPDMVSKRWNHFAVKEGDYLLSASASTGAVALATTEVAGAIPYTGIIRLWARSQQTVMEYVRLFMNSRLFQDQIDLAKSGVGIEHFGPKHLNMMVMVLPPVAEQETIVNAFKRAIIPLTEATAGAHREINLLREYRTRLIADVVTGKLDVREAAAELPEEDVSGDA